MPDPTRKLEVAFASNPFSTSPTWTDVTSDVRELSFIRGRERELDEFRAGTLTAVLDNRDRAYDPLHSTNVKPMKRVRYSEIFSGSTYRLFDGYADEWQQGYDKPKEATATLMATDGFKILAAKGLEDSVYEQEVANDAPVFWAKVDEASDATQVVDSIANRAGTLTDSPTLGATGLRTLPAGSALQTNDINDQVSFTSSPLTGAISFSVEFLIRVNGNPGTDRNIIRQRGPDEDVNSTNDGWFVQLTTGGLIRVGAQDGSGLFQSFVNSGTATVTDNAVHHILITYTSGGNFTIYRNGVDVTNVLAVPATLVLHAGPIDIGATNNGIAIQSFVGTIDEVVLYSSVLSSARASAHNSAARTPWNGDKTGARLGRILDAVSWPSSLRNIDTGDTTCQSSELDGGDALAYVQKIRETEAGHLFMAKDGKVRLIARSNTFGQTAAATFGDSGSELRYVELEFDYSDQPIINEVTVSRDRGVAMTASDTTSQTSYLKRSLTKEGLLHNSETESLSHAQFLIYQRKDPRLRIASMAIAPQRDSTNLFPVVLARELGDMVTVRRRPQGVGTLIEEDLIVEGIEYRVMPKVWEVRWKLSSAELLRFWKLGTSGYTELGQTTILGF